MSKIILKTSRPGAAGRRGLLFAICHVFIVSVLVGCRVVRPVAPESGHYYLNPESNFSGISKVVVVELEDRTAYPAQARRLAEAVAAEMQKKHIFNVRFIACDEQAYQDLQLNRSRFTLEELSRIRTTLSADAVVIGVVTEYDSYPHLAAGLNLRMLDLKNGRVVWGIEQLWDSADKDLEARLRGYFRREMRDDHAPMDWRYLVTSPRAFEKFVAWETAQTLPAAADVVDLRLTSGNLDD